MALALLSAAVARRRVAARFLFRSGVEHGPAAVVRCDPRLDRHDQGRRNSQQRCRIAHPARRRLGFVDRDRRGAWHWHGMVEAGQYSARADSRNLLPAAEVSLDSCDGDLAWVRRQLQNFADLPRLYAAGDAGRLQRRTGERASARVAGAEHGRRPAAHVVGCGGPKRAAGTAQWHPHRNCAFLHSTGVLGIDRSSQRLRLSDRLSRGQRHLRCDVRGRVHRRLPRIRRRPHLSPAGATDAVMAAIDRPTNGGPRRFMTLPELALRFLRSVSFAGARVFSIVLLAALWEALARSGVVTHFQLPALSEVIERIWSDGVSGDLWINTGLTLYRAMVGFAIAAAGGIVLGMAMSRLALARWVFDPIISVGFPMPKIAFLPVVILWLGVFDISKITMIVFDANFPVVAATVIAIQGVERELIWSARNMGANERELLWQIVLPAALPQIMTGLQVALPISLIVAVVTEMLMGGYGLGGAMITASRFANSTGVFAGIVEIAIVGYALVKAMALIRRRLLIWHQEANAPTTV